MGAGASSVWNTLMSASLVCCAGPGVDGRKGSYIGARRRQRGLPPTDPATGKAPPTNEEIAQAVQEKVAVRPPL